MDGSYFSALNPLDQTIIGTLFAWLVTALGASAVFFTRSVNRKFFDALLGFAAGIMLAASFFSLLLPSIIPSFQSDDSYYWVPVATGFILGAMVICVADIIIKHLYRKNQDRNSASITPTSIEFESKTILVLAITIHNIPEGLAIGVLSVRHQLVLWELI